MYSKKVLDHFKNPRNQGPLKNATIIEDKKNPVCGDSMKIYLNIKDGIIKDIKFETLGCVAAIALSSLLTEYVKGMTVADAKKVTKKDLVKEADGLPAAKVHCSILGIDALKAALDKYEKNQKNKKFIKQK